MQKFQWVFIQGDHSYCKGTGTVKDQNCPYHKKANGFKLYIDHEEQFNNWYIFHEQLNKKSI